MPTRVVVVTDDGMSAQTRGFLKQIFQGEITGKAPCEHCGGLHQRECGRVKRIVWHPSGERPSEVEYWKDEEWDRSVVIWPEDVFND